MVSRQVNPTRYEDHTVDAIIDCSAVAIIASGVAFVSQEMVAPMIVYSLGSLSVYFVRRNAYLKGDTAGRSWNRKRYESRINELEMELAKRPVRVANTATRTELRNVIEFPNHVGRKLPELCRALLDNGGRVSNRVCCSVDGLVRDDVTIVQNRLIEGGLAVANPRTRTTILNDDGMEWARGFASPAPESE